ncbi:MAG: T9SS type A sorting domain-containing protein [Bacteroidales bacterium]|nr:T9SS type A sorting domain-containing protein [Bacteroidales bacterium]
MILIFISPNPLQSQLSFVHVISYELKVDGEVIKNPWAGGFNSPQFSMIDLDQDGKLDLVSFERSYYGVFKSFLNTGTSGNTDFKYAPEYLYQFPHLQNWVMLVDYNCDGHEDIFSSVPAGIQIYKNEYSEKNGNHFTLETSILPGEGLNGQEPIYVSPPDLPAITDVDGDGDVDILSFEILGNHVAYFKNMSMEKYGNCDFLEFELKNACWGYFSENATNNTLILYDTCDMNVEDPEKSEKHAGSTLLAFDHNGDGVTDLALGDISYNTLSLLTNGGTPLSAVMTDVEYNFPSSTIPVDMTTFPAAYLLDINNDGNRDLLVSPNNPNTSQNHNNIWFYRNAGSDEDPEFTFQQENFLQEEMVDVGAGAFAVFFDENADGLSDIFIGNFGYFIESGVYQSQLALLRNVGTVNDPSFDWITGDYDDLSTFGFNGIYPAFGDMDNDGDQDMLIGDEEGMLHYFRNDAGPGNPVDFTLSQPNYWGIDIGQSAKPQIIDVNRDGLPDLLLGERSGTINYFHNAGTPVSPDFSQEPTNGLFGGIDVMPECCTGYSAPQMVEDSVGNYMLYVGSEQGMLYLFNNIEGNLTGTFNPVDSLYLNGMNINISAFDINNDGKLELVRGEYAGGIGFFKNGHPQVFGVNTFTENDLRISVYPNPAENIIFIDFNKNPNLTNLTLHVYDLFGKIQVRHNISPVAQMIFLDISGLSSGVYILKVVGIKEIATSRFIVK